MMEKKRKKAGHRRWAPRGGVVAGGHSGDIMSVAARSALMSRIRGKDTGPERLIAARLAESNVAFDQHARDLPGRPDIVLRSQKVAVFIDGDFWHGWRFPLWKSKLSEKWQCKIEATRQRDQRNFRRLRNMGWRVVRIWEHEVERDLERAAKRLFTVLGCC
jgi:DNA mismatch endonuclease (patch repair protein)